jgi:RNase P/RNase MRP subunit POP5
MRQRRRYVVFKIVDGGRAEISRAVGHLKQGIEGGALIKLVEFDEEIGLGLLSCGNLQLPEVKTKISEVAGKTKITVVGVSGTVKKAKKKFMSPR